MKKRWFHRLRVVEALGWLILLTIALRFAPIDRLIGHGRRLGAAVADQDLGSGQDVARAVRRAARIAPQYFRCLPQALAARMMLRYRGIPTRLHLSAGRSTYGIDAHAWLSHRGLVLLGQGAPAGQVELAQFD